MGWGKGQGCGQKAEIVVLNFYHEWEGNGSVVLLRQLVLGPDSRQLPANAVRNAPGQSKSRMKSSAFERAYGIGAHPPSPFIGFPFCLLRLLANFVFLAPMLMKTFRKFIICEVIILFQQVVFRLV